MYLVAMVPHEYKDLGLGSLHPGAQTYPLTYSFPQLVRM